jgi:DNA-directed RNA polymerase subunit K/omega
MKRVTIDYDNIQTQSKEDQPLKLNPKRYEEGDNDEDDDEVADESDEDVAIKSASAAGIYKSKPKSSSDLKGSQRTGIGIEEDEDVNEDDSENDDDDDDEYEESGDDDDNASNYSYENDEAEEADTGKDKEGESDEEDEADNDSTGDLQDDEDEDRDSETGNDDRYQKINQEFRKNYIAETHPEAKSHTDDEIHALAKVVRDKTGTIVDPLHRTIPVLTKYEKTRILGIRTKQLNNGAESYITSKVNITSEKVVDGYPIALRELEEKKLPFIIRRPLPGGGMEYWYLQDLEIL